MKKTLVIIIVGLSGVIGYQMEQMTKLKQSNTELEKQNTILEDKLNDWWDCAAYTTELMGWVEETYGEIYMEEEDVFVD